jgi:DNA polymerase III epsilon subunit-like protein
MQTFVIDFETAFDKEYSLKKLSTSDYIMDARFKVLGFSYKWNDDDTRYVKEVDVSDNLYAMRDRIAAAILVAHHAQFDGAILSWHYQVLPRFVCCTLSMSRALGHDVLCGGNSLEKLMQYYNLGEKGFLSPTSSAEELRVRAMRDVDATYDLYKRFLPQFDATELACIDWTIRAYTTPQVRADRARLENIIVGYDQALGAALDRCGLASADELRSPSKFATALEALGVQPPTKISSRTGKEAYAFAKTDEGMVELLESSSPEVAALAGARLGSKSGGDADRAERLLRMSGWNGKLPVYLNYAGTHTLRWSGGDKCNWQNFKRGGEIRKSILPPEGCVFVVGDLAQIEARMAAWVCGCEVLLEAFRDPDPDRDVYGEFGTLAFGYPVTKATEYERFSSKGTFLGSIFGGGAPKLAAQLAAEVRKRGLKLTPPDVSTVKMLSEQFRTIYKEIPDGWRRLEGLLRQPGCEFGPVVSEGTAFRLPNGLRLHYPDLALTERGDANGRYKKQWEYRSRTGPVSVWGGKLMENVASSLAGCLFRWQLVRVDRALQKLGGGVVTNSHDEIVAVCPEEQVDKGVEIMQHWMTRGPSWCEGLPINAEIGTGDTYGSAKS